MWDPFKENTQAKKDFFDFIKYIFPYLCITICFVTLALLCSKIYIIHKTTNTISCDKVYEELKKYQAPAYFKIVPVPEDHIKIQNNP